MDSHNGQPLSLVWFQPRRAVRAALHRPFLLTILILSALSGLTQLASSLTGEPTLAFEVDLPVVLLVTAVAALLGIAGLYISAWITQSVGDKLGGRAQAGELRFAYAWSAIPQIALSACAALIVLGSALYAPQLIDGPGTPSSSIGSLLDVVLLVGAIWSLIALVTMVAEIQCFSLQRSFLNIVLTTLIIMCVALLVRVFLFQPFSAASMSMAPTLQAGDHVFANKFNYGYGRHSFPFSLDVLGGRWFDAPAQYGDVVVFNKSSNSGGVTYIKRIVGLPGDTVKLTAGVLSINGTQVPKRATGTYKLDLGQGRTESAEVFAEMLPNGATYKILDAKKEGAFDTTVPVVVPVGHYFVLGDNRDNSLDSRINHFGFVGQQQLIGRASLIWFAKRWDQTMKLIE